MVSLPWSIPLRLAVGSILGILGGAGLLGYLSEYATYLYAIRLGIRPPLEGIPYLRPAISLGSVAILLSAAVVFLLGVLLLKLTITLIESYLEGLKSLLELPMRLRIRADGVEAPEMNDLKILENYRGRPLWWVALFSIGVGLGFGLFAYIIAALDATNNRSLSHIGAIVAIFAYGAAITLLLLRPGWVYWIITIATTVYFFCWIYFLFSQKPYSSFLKFIGYGGGLPVVVELQNESSIVGEKSHKYFLALRTTEAIIVYDKNTSQFIEISRDKLQRLTHDSGGLSGLASELPN